MITAKFLQSSKNLTINVSGHAGFATSGQDIVCAAVSVLTTAVINEIVKRSDCLVNDDDSGLLFSINDSEVNPAIEALITLLKVNLLNIAEQYPENVKVVEVSKSQLESLVDDFLNDNGEKQGD